MDFDREEARQAIFALLADATSIVTQDRRLDIASFKSENARIVREAALVIERWTDTSSKHRADVALAKQHAGDSPHLAADLLIDVLALLRDELSPQPPHLGNTASVAERGALPPTDSLRWKSEGKLDRT